MESHDVERDDQQLLVDARKGSELAFRQLFDKYWNDLFIITYRRTRSAEDAKDILQDVFLSLWNNIDSINVEDSLGGYLYASVRNRVFNHLEKKQLRLHWLMQQPFYPAESESTILSTLGTKELRQHIQQQILAMPVRMQLIYRLSKEEQLSHAQIASLLDLSIQTVKNQQHLALNRLRKSLAGSGFSWLTLLPALIYLR